MNIIDLGIKYKDFYVPAFKVMVNGKDLVRELFLTVTTTEVDLKEKTAGRFSFTVANAFDWEERSFVSIQNNSRLNLIELFEFGSEVEILFGYGDPSELPLILRGIITEISTSFSEGGIPELSVSGYDKLYYLTIGKETRNWEQKRDSDVVSELVEGTGLSLNVEETIPEKPRIEKGQESDMDFLIKLAERNSFTFYVRENEFYFGARNKNATGDIELEWGKGLLSFSPEANLAGQVGSVEVRSVSAERGELIIGRAFAGDESDTRPRARSGSEHISGALNNQPSITVRASVHTQEEADRLAQAVLDERGQNFITGNGESIGLPEILPDINLEIKELGQPFSQIYYINGAKHTINGSGYKTSWNAEQNRLEESST